MNQTKRETGQWTFLSALIEAVKPQPAYALIFGLSALFFLFGIGSGVAAVVQHDQPELWYFAFGGLLASLVAAVTVIRKLEPPFPRQEPADKKTVPTSQSMDPNFDDVLYAIHENVRKALTCKNETFRDAILHGCDNFRVRTAEWGNGQIVAHQHYNELLLSFYEGAKESVFSTSIPSYLSTWQSPFGDQLLDAHRRSRVSVTRLFLFNQRNEVTDEAIKVMENQSKSGINVRLLFSDEVQEFVDLPTDISKDFTVIDHGEAIGITLSFGGSNLAAEWFIEDRARKRRFERVCSSLTKASESFTKFDEWWRKSRPA